MKVYVLNFASNFYCTKISVNSGLTLDKDQMYQLFLSLQVCLAFTDYRCRNCQLLYFTHPILMISYCKNYISNLSAYPKLSKFSNIVHTLSSINVHNQLIFWLITFSQNKRICIYILTNSGLFSFFGCAQMCAASLA